MQRELCAYLDDISAAITAIRSFTGGLNFESFRSDDLILSAVIRKFEIICEALKQCIRLYPDAMASISKLRTTIWQCDPSVHAYFDLDALVLWQSMESDLPLLRSHIASLQDQHCR